MTKYLVLATGLTGSGKGTFSKYMETELDFYRACPEEIRDEIYGSEHISDYGKRVAAKAHATDVTLERVRTKLGEGRNVVIDSGAPTNKRRHELLDEFDNEDYKKCILIFQADTETRIQRVQKRPGYGKRLSLDMVEKIVRDDVSNWEEPDIEGVEIIRYINETQEDIAVIQNGLSEQFG